MTDIAIIPARGGSKGIPRKNIRNLSGKPLFWYVVQTCLESGCFDEIVVTTDDDEIAHVASQYEVLVHRRPPELGADQTTLDAVIHDVVQARGKQYGWVATIQPTSPLLRVSTIQKAMGRLRNSEEIDTLVSVVNDPHLTWIKREGRIVPAYEKRVNRQFLPAVFRETGAFIITRGSLVTPESRFGPRVDVFEVPEDEAIDIDSMNDWWIVERILKRKRVAIRVDAHRQIGFGHLYRMLMLVNRLLDHEIRFFLDQTQDQAIERVRSSFYPYATIAREDIPQAIHEWNPDILINDILDTAESDVLFFKEKGIFVVNFEDLGPGITHADLVINALYETDIPYPHVYSGSSYYCLREDFAHTTPRAFSAEVTRIIITFGGADPNDLTRKSVVALGKFAQRNDVSIIVLLGLAYPEKLRVDLIDEIRKRGWAENFAIKQDVRSMAAEIREADLAITSCGRTMYEAASLGAPTVLMAANDREMRHSFGHPENGFVNLGMGVEVDPETILKTVAGLVENPERRREMREGMLRHDFSKGLDRVTALILQKYEEWVSEKEARVRGR